MKGNFPAHRRGLWRSQRRDLETFVPPSHRPGHAETASAAPVFSPIRRRLVIAYSLVYACLPRHLPAPSRRSAMWDSPQDLGFAEQRHSHIDARNDLIVGFELRRDAVCFSIVRIVKPAALPMTGSIGLKIPKDRQAAKSTSLQCLFWILLVLVQLTLKIARNFQPYDSATHLGPAIKGLNDDSALEKPLPLRGVRPSGDGGEDKRRKGRSQQTGTAEYAPDTMRSIPVLSQEDGSHFA